MNKKISIERLGITHVVWYEVMLNSARSCQSQMVKPFMLTWNWRLTINYMIPQVQRNTWCMHMFLNVEVSSGGDIIYNSRTGLSVGEVATLRLLVSYCVY